MIGALVLILGTGIGGQVVLRAHEALPAPKVISVSAAGVAMGAGERPEFILGWDRVLSVSGPMAGEAAPFEATGEALWRARTRLERGDAAAAEPIFERLLPELTGVGGPMPEVAAEGLLRCRLRRGAQVAAIEPWLAWLDARGAAVVDGARPFDEEWAAQAGLDSIMDPATGLIPALPPIWLDWPAVRVYAVSVAPGAGTEGSAGGKAAALARLYRHSARFEAGAGEPVPAVAAAGDPGVALVLDIVQARAGGESDRASARDRLAKRLAGERDSWVEAWCRAGIGRSLILESDPETRRLGIVQLVHLPARFSRTHPYLAGLCLTEASAALADLGDRVGAASLRRELLDNYPEHPVLAWEKIRLPAGPAATVPTGGSRAGTAPGVIPFDMMECPKP